jgi:hypothetical protein
MPGLKRGVIFDSEARDVIKKALSSSIPTTKIDTRIINIVMGGFTETVDTRKEAELAANTFMYEVQRKLGKKSLIIGELSDKNSEVHDFLKSTLGYPENFPAGRDTYIEKFLEHVAFRAGEAANKKRRRR